MKSVKQPDLRPVSMEAAVGYPSINCLHQNPVEHSVVLKHNRYFFLANSRGDVAPAGHCSLGLFFDDTRVLSHYALSFRGGPASLLSTQILHSFTGQIDLAITDTDFGGNSWDPKNCIHIHREILLDDRMMERLTVSNYFNHPVDYWVELEIGSDFADIFEVRGWKREKRGQYFEPVVAEGKLSQYYRGLDGQLLGCSVRFQEPFPILTANRARWNLHLEANGQFTTEWQVLAESDDAKGLPGFCIDEKRRDMNREYDHWGDACARWTADVKGFQKVLGRAVDDLRALQTETEGVPVISAGIPWFSTSFGRDAIITSIQTLSLNPQIARDTLCYMARYQGAKEDAFTEEEPGKIMHEIRRGEMARTGEIPHVPYYGTVDATPLWLVLLHETWHWTGDEALVRDLFPHAERALQWIDEFGDLDGDGFVEYQKESDGGLSNQGWKDSGDGIPFPDARMPEPPIALVEVQGYVYDAKMRMAELCEVLGKANRALELREQAAKLREAIIEKFWMGDAGTFALGLDREKQPLSVVTSNAGHLLWSGVPDTNQARRIADVLLGPTMNSGWGIRTLSSEHPVFNPMSYHNGSVWPHDNAIIILGLARYRLGEAALPVVSGLYEAAAHDEFQRLPELFCGMARGHGNHPILYPVSCSPQAWASGAFFMILQAMLGIYPDAPEHTLRIRNPILPEFLDELTLSNLEVGRSKVALKFSRYQERTLVNLLSIAGDPLHVQIELN